MLKRVESHVSSALNGFPKGEVAGQAQAKGDRPSKRTNQGFGLWPTISHGRTDDQIILPGFTRQQDREAREHEHEHRYAFGFARGPERGVQIRRQELGFDRSVRCRPVARRVIGWEVEDRQGGRQILGPELNQNDLDNMEILVFGIYLY